MKAQCCLSCRDPDCQRLSENQRLLDQAEYSATERIEELKNERAWRWWCATAIVAFLGWALALVHP